MVLLVAYTCNSTTVMIPVYCNGGGLSRLSEGPRPRSGMGGRDDYDVDDDDIDDNSDDDDDVDPEVFFEQHAEFNDDNNTTDDGYWRRTEGS